MSRYIMKIILGCLGMHSGKPTSEDALLDIHL